MKKIFLATLFVWTNLLANGQVQYNEIPMYGFINRTEKLEKADNDFIKSCIKEFGNRQNASKEYVKLAWGKYLYKNDLSTAIKRFNQSWLLDSTNCDSYYGFVAYMHLKGDTNETKYYLSIALSHDKENKGLTKYFLSLAHLYDNKGAIDAEIKTYKSLLDIDSTGTFYLQKLGYLYMNKKDSLNSLKYLNKAIIINPKDSLSFLNRGWLYHENKLYEKAINDFNKVIEIQPTYVWAYSNRAESYFALGDYKNYIEDQYKCISLTPQSEHGQFYRLIGLAKIKNNDKISGCEYLKKAIDIGDTYKDLDKKGFKKYYKETCK